MIRISQYLVLCLSAIVVLGGCSGKLYTTVPPTSETITTIWLLEQVMDQQAHIEALEWEIARLWEWYELELNTLEAEMDTQHWQRQKVSIEAQGNAKGVRL